jgi:adenine-specific DNA-methyltransferase
VHLVRGLLDEVFGSENFCAHVAFAKTSGLASALLPARFDFLLWYAKQKATVKRRRLFREKSAEAGTADTYTWVELPDGSRRGMTSAELADRRRLPPGSRVYVPADISSQGNPFFPFEYLGKTYIRPWKTTHVGLSRLAHAGRLHIASNSIRYVRYLADFGFVPITQLWDDTATGSFTEDKKYVVQTARAGDDRGEHRLLVGVAREDEDPDRRILGSDLARRLDA